jgi:hypothetical protein
VSAAPALSVLDRLVDNAVLFTLGANGVDGVITIYDLNHPSAHLLGFGLIIVCEEAISQWIRIQLGSDAEAAAEKVRRLNPGGAGYARWKKQGQPQSKRPHIRADARREDQVGQCSRTR